MWSRAVQGAGRMARAAAWAHRQGTRAYTMATGEEGPTVVALNRVFGGIQGRYTHYSESTGTEMAFSVFVPAIDELDDDSGVYLADCSPYVMWLSGLTCDDTNFIFKAGAQQHLNRERLVCVCPDTSPRGLGLPGEDDSYDFGSGAGFYVDATEAPWSANYNMDTYVNQELPEYIEKHFPVLPHKSIMGHSMGGHGALTSFLNHPGKYQSVSAFSPICNPSAGPWGHKAFTGYLGPDEQTWMKYDASVILHDMAKAGEELPKILISVGDDDQFLDTELMVGSLPAHPNLKVNIEDGYDHSYYFIATFIEEHIKWHARALYQNPEITQRN